MRIKFSARAWLLGAATGLVILPTTSVEMQAASKTAAVEEKAESSEPRKLIERPATRQAISTSRPARSFFPSLFPGLKKKAPAKPAASVQQTAPTVAAPPADGKSDVQRHLEELYRQNGRKAPELGIDEFTNDRIVEAIPEAGKPTQAPIRQVSSNPFKRFFQKITPFRRPQKDPRDETPDHVEPMTKDMRQQQLRLQQAQPVTAAKPTPAAKPLSQPKPKAPEVPASPAPQLSSLLPPLPAPAGKKEEVGGDGPLQAPALLSDAVAEKIAPASEAAKAATELADKLPEFKPAVELPKADAPPTLTADLPDVPVGKDTEEPAAAPPVLNEDLLADPFPALSEAEADGGKEATEKPAILKKPEVAQKAVEAKSNPFTGLKLEADQKTDGEVKQTAADSAPTLTLPELPAPDAVPLPGDAAPAEIAAPDDATPAEKLPEITPAEKPAENKHQSKLQKIAERSELKGLKGFCPVALRDSRELVDARPQFQVAFNGRIYNLSSEEAKAKFETEPELYAPAAGGQDVVLASQKQTDSEGSLDHAVWFRNRLYLFTTQQSLIEFELTPAKFAIEISDAEE